MNCEQREDSAKAQYLRTIFDTSPIPTFIVDDDVRIQDCNRAATQLIGRGVKLALHHRGGDVLHCVNAEAHGCGHAEPCKNCVIRNSVTQSIDGLATHRQTQKAELRAPDGGVASVDLLITTSRLPDTESRRVLLILEDVSEVNTLRGLVPICARCRKVRDDQDFWQNIDAYLRKNLNVKLAQGLCPECFAQGLKAAEERLKSAPNPPPGAAAPIAGKAE
jgi:hypothetical protein